MGKINMARVILGGLLAGVVINIGEFILNMPILGNMWNDVLKSLNRPTMDTMNPTFFVILSFILGIFIVWVYAAIRPRFGAGPMTAVCAGLIVWALVVLYSSASSLPMHLFPRRMLLYVTVWDFVELPLASLLGCWLYKEEA